MNQISVLNIKATNGCNLRCRGCSHHSQWATPGSSIDVDQMMEDITTLSKRMQFSDHVSLLGGEVLLESRWSELLTHIEDSFDCDIRFYTNGLILDKHIDKVVEHLKRGTDLRISLHVFPHTPMGKKVFENVSLLLKQYNGGGGHILFSENLLDVWSDTVKYDGNKIKPYNSPDVSQSYQHCPCVNVQLYKGRLWKCAQTAYLKDTLHAMGQIDDPDWAPYLKYDGVSIHAPQEDLDAFVERQYEPEWFCAICPQDGAFHHREQDMRFKKIPIKQV